MTQVKAPDGGLSVNTNHVDSSQIKIKPGADFPRDGGAGQLQGRFGAGR